MTLEEKKIRNLEQALSDGLLNEIKKLLRKQANEDGKFNILRVFGIEELEIRHSFMLKWLLSPKENHGLGASFLKLFLKEVVCENDKACHGRYKVLRNVDCASFVICREKESVDLLLISKKDKVVIAVENKWNACERIDEKNHEGQLSKYKKWVSKRFGGWKQYFVFLTPDKRLPSENNIGSWGVLGYENIRRILKKSIERLKTKVAFREQRLLLRHYYRILRRKLDMDGPEMKSRCTEIYDQYREELNFLVGHADRRDPLLRMLYKGIKIRRGEFLKAEESNASSYVQYKRRIPAEVSNSVHYEVSIGEKECKVLLHIEKGTDDKIRKGLLEAVLSKCSEVADVAPISRRKRKDSDDPNLLGGAEIRIPRRGRSDADVENDIRKALRRIYEVFESILQGFEKRKK